VRCDVRGGNALHIVFISVHVRDGVVGEDGWCARVVRLVDISGSLLV
jgi:hypothetical protein